MATKKLKADAKRFTTEHYLAFVLRGWTNEQMHDYDDGLYKHVLPPTVLLDVTLNKLNKLIDEGYFDDAAGKCSL